MLHDRESAAIAITPNQTHNHRPENAATLAVPRD